MKISSRVRRQAALICAIATSRDDGGYMLYPIAKALGADGVAHGFAFRAVWHVVDQLDVVERLKLIGPQFSAACNRQIDAAAQALIESGWSP